MQLGNDKLSIETGKVAKQADGAAWVQYGETVVLVTVVASRQASNLDFFPLTVDYRERGYANGRIPPVYGRREPRPGDNEQLTARLIDHCIRPLFPKDFKSEIQVLCTVLSFDGKHSADVPSLIGASVALSVSDIPFNGPVGAIVIGRINDEFVINPTVEEMETCEFEFFVGGNEKAVMSVEGSAHETSEDEAIDAIFHAHGMIKEIIKLQEGLVAVVGQPKREYTKKEIDQELLGHVRTLATDQIRQSIGMEEKQGRSEFLEKVQESILEEILADKSLEEAEIREVTTNTIAILSDIEKEEMRRSILEEGKRVDGRSVKEVRQIIGEVSVLPRTHGSALFSRGQTQALCAVTLGSSTDEVTRRTLAGDQSHAFFLHYNFLPYSVGEVKRMMGPGRRDIGHGSLAEKAVAPVIPSEEDFNYTIRVVSEILESNASSSMATVCGATLALMDAGVPISKMVAGVGVGLIKEGDQEVILTDMLGTEDFLGDMDFKVAGTETGLTAIQMDIKIDGVTPDLMRKAIHQAKEARLHVLSKMREIIVEPRADLSEYAPRIYTIQIPTAKIKDLIGPRGRVVQGIQEETGVTIAINDDGKVEIASTDGEAAKKAEELIAEITAVPEVDKEYVGEVVRTTNFGAFINILPGCDGLVHISKMGEGYVARVEEVMDVGDKVTVRVADVNDNGQVDLIMVSVERTEANIAKAAEGSSDSGSDRNRSSRDSRNQRDSGGNRRRPQNRDNRDSRDRDSRDRDSRGRSRSMRIPKDRD
jgi:polyribonucleotide nucleotidyltransferase